MITLFSHPKLREGFIAAVVNLTSCSFLYLFLTWLFSFVTPVTPIPSALPLQEGIHKFNGFFLFFALVVRARLGPLTPFAPVTVLPF